MTAKVDPEEPEPRKPTRAPESPNCVTIFGAGIAGMTAAHELVERGFHVQVWECARNQRYPRRGCEVGGMARTQWSRVHWPATRDVGVEPLSDEEPPKLDEKSPKEPEPGQPESEQTEPSDGDYGRETQPIVPLDQKFYLKFPAGPDAKPAFVAALKMPSSPRRAGDKYLLAPSPEAVAQVRDDLLRQVTHARIQHVYVEICYANTAHRSRDWGELLNRANQVLDLFRALPTTSKVKIGEATYSQNWRHITFVLTHPKTSVTFELAILDESPMEVPLDTDIVIGFRVRERWLPGEHGYRFFPAFYRHVFDTMKRTPLLEPTQKSLFALEQERSAGITGPEPARYTETGRTAYDNIRPLSCQVLAFTNYDKPEEFSRFRPRSLEELRDYLHLLFSSRERGGFGLEPRDALRITLRTLQFLTSCQGRRRDLESKSWWDFMRADTYSEAAQHLTENWPRALVAMDARSADARTYGIGFTQLTLDLVRPDGYRDGSLKGPTSEAWLNPWRRYLEAQGVEFIHGRLEGFQWVRVKSDDPKGHLERRVWPIANCFEPRYKMRDEWPPTPDPKNPDDQVRRATQPDLMPGYFILALSPLEARHIAKKYCKLVYGDSSPPETSDLGKMARYASDASDGAIRTPPEKSKDFRHFVGIQYYFAEDVFWVDGHVFYPDSPWSLTSVSQTRFWDDRTDWEHGYRGILSVIIGDWTTPGMEVTSAAAECSKEEIAKEVWAQIKESVRRDLQSRSPTGGQSVAERTVESALPSPLYWHIDDNYIARQKDELARNNSPFPITAPGSWDTRPGSVDGHYEIEHGIVLAGAHLKTFTRLPTMEAANESGRRAVNAIINHTRDEQPQSRSYTRGSRYRRSFCDLWNPEEDEVKDLQWWKDLDKKLHERGIEHCFEVYGFDHLARDLLRGGIGDPLDPVALLTKLRRLFLTMLPALLGRTVRRAAQKGNPWP